MAKYITAFSDSHGARYNVSRLVGDCEVSDRIVFLGDGLSDLIELFEFEDKIIKVAGNCDFTLSESKKVIFEVDGVKFLAVHGDQFGVKLGLDRLTSFAKQNGCKAALFGHTHKPIVIEIDGVTLINPGTLSRHGDSETFAFISVKNGEISAKIIPLNKRV